MHEIKKNNDTLWTVITIEGAWLNLLDRKLFIPPSKVTHVFQQMPVDENFQWLD